MKLIVGLGNPGRQYQGTRHNIGFEVLDELARRLELDRTQERFHGRVGEAVVGGERLLLLWPQTYMNASGRSVAAACQFYRLALPDVLIVCDDFSLPLGRVRFRRHGSGGGQKGLEDVLRSCGTDVPRLRIGIGPLPPGRDPAAFVLAAFLPEERPTVQKVVRAAADAALDWIEHGIEYCMNRYNAWELAAAGQDDPSPQTVPPSGPKKPTC